MHHVQQRFFPRANPGVTNRCSMKWHVQWQSFTTLSKSISFPRLREGSQKERALRLWFHAQGPAFVKWQDLWLSPSRFKSVLTLLCAHTSCRTSRRTPWMTCKSQSPASHTQKVPRQSSRRGWRPHVPLCLLLFFFLDTLRPLTLSFVSISSLLSQDSPDTERTSSAGTQEASKPQRDFTRMTSNNSLSPERKRWSKFRKYFSGATAKERGVDCTKASYTSE